MTVFEMIAKSPDILAGVMDRCISDCDVCPVRYRCTMGPSVDCAGELLKWIDSPLPDGSMSPADLLQHDGAVWVLRPGGAEIKCYLVDAGNEQLVDKGGNTLPICYAGISYHAYLERPVTAA